MKSHTFGSFTATTVIIAVVSAMLVFTPTSRAVTPAPDGGYPGGNTAEGTNALFSLTSGILNTATGFNALFSDTTGGSNTADGANALRFNTTGSQNKANGAFALYHNTTGDNNIGIGHAAGFYLTTGDNNIDIGNPGVPDEADTIRIGVEGLQTATFIAGINDVVLTSMSATQVCVDDTGQLGECNPSSERFKHDIEPMEKASEVILALKPVTFRYNLDPKEAAHFGLVAEEVEKVAPHLVRYDKNGKINGVHYEAVNAMLLNEFLKEHRRVEEQANRLAEQERAIKTLTAGLKDQAAQIQKVSAELTLIKSKPQLVDNAK
jgi:uncharacterized coiled-coil protein SlyX